MRNAQIKERELECFIISCEVNSRGLEKPFPFITLRCLPRDRVQRGGRMKTQRQCRMGSSVYSSVVTFLQPHPVPTFLTCSLPVRASCFLLDRHECAGGLFVGVTGCHGAQGSYLLEILTWSVSTGNLTSGQVWDCRRGLAV